MKKNMPLIAILLLFGSCSFLRSHLGSNSSAKDFNQSNESVRPNLKNRAIIHMVSPLGLEIELVNLEDKKRETFLVDKTLSQIEMRPGHWKVVGIIHKGIHHKLMNTSKQFIFQIKKDKNTYVGSYIFQCPKVTRIHVDELKQMGFFNRYPFTSKTGLCELVVGSDFERVNRVWGQLSQDQNSLELGF